VTTGRQGDQHEHRLAKLNAAQARGGDAYPYRWPVDATCAGIHDAHPDLAPDVVTDDRVSLAGRLALVRRQGGLTFAQLRDRTGAIQLFVDTDALGAERHHAFDDLDRGDWVGVEGVVLTTRRGELSVRVERFALLGKALREPPDKHRGLTDVETRYRQRYVDLEVNERTRDRPRGVGRRPCVVVRSARCCSRWSPRCSTASPRR
jgi:lysyl-tRNA synthetase class 2